MTQASSSKTRATEEKKRKRAIVPLSATHEDGGVIRIGDTVDGDAFAAKAAESPRAHSNGSALVSAAAREFSAQELDALGDYAKSGAPAWYGDLLKFNGKTGQWSAGSQGLPIEQGRQLVAIIPVMIGGCMLWKDGELADQAWKPILKFKYHELREKLGDQDQDLWPRNEEGEPEDPWKEAVMLPLVDLATREEFTFSSSSVGGVRAAKRLVDTYTKQIMATPETTKGCLQVVALGSSSYKHKDKKRGTLYNPVFEGIEWIRASDLSLPPEPGTDSEPPDDGAPEQPLPLR
jgi:hypothetical protein